VATGSVMPVTELETGLVARDFPAWWLPENPLICLGVAPGPAQLQPGRRGVPGAEGQQPLSR